MSAWARRALVYVNFNRIDIGSRFGSYRRYSNSHVPLIKMAQEKHTSDWLDVVTESQDVQGVEELLKSFKGTEKLMLCRTREIYKEAGRTTYWKQVAGEEDDQKQRDTAKAVFDVESFMWDCRPSGKRYGAVLLYGHCLTSTQTIMFDNILQPLEGMVCVADVQTSGRGRGSNVWTSPPGCLLFTYMSVVKDGLTLPLVQYIVCLAIVEAVKSFPGYDKLDIGIKWPNDIYVDRTVKIGGILCQSVFRNGQFQITIGVGLNVDNDVPTTCINALGRDGHRISRERLLARILERYEDLHTEFVTQGFAPRIQREYEANWLHNGQEVSLVDTQERPCKAVIQGLSIESGGCLLAKDTETGAIYELMPDGNRLDFFKGLIMKKK